MYTREYAKEEGAGILIPEHYGGVAFSEDEGGEMTTNELHSEETSARGEPPRRGGLEGIWRGLRDAMPKRLTEIIPTHGDGERLFGTEELLLAGLAAFLFFSKEGDRECALMLLLLLFIK